VSEAERLSPLVLLQAYQAVLARNPNRADLSTRYDLVLDGLAKSHPHNLTVQRALAKRELSKRSPEGNAAAESYLSKAVELKSQSPQDYMLLSELLYRGGRKQEAVTILERAIALFPYVPTPYQNLSVCYISMGNAAKAREVLKNGLQMFPSDANLRAIQRRLESSP
jgi:Flp pilus assembly protein TadD